MTVPSFTEVVVTNPNWLLPLRKNPMKPNCPAERCVGSGVLVEVGVIVGVLVAVEVGPVGVGVFAVLEMAFSRPEYPAWPMAQAETPAKVLPISTLLLDSESPVQFQGFTMPASVLWQLTTALTF